MSSKSKIKSLLAMQQASSQDVANALNITVAAARNKLSRNSWAVNDLIRLADGLGVNLAFVGADGRAVITFESRDAEPEPAPTITK